MKKITINNRYYIKNIILAYNNLNLEISNTKDRLKEINKKMDEYYDFYGHVFDSNFPEKGRLSDKLRRLTEHKKSLDKILTDLGQGHLCN